MLLRLRVLIGLFAVVMLAATIPILSKSTVVPVSLWKRTPLMAVPVEIPMSLNCTRTVNQRFGAKLGMYIVHTFGGISDTQVPRDPSAFLSVT